MYRNTRSDYNQLVRTRRSAENLKKSVLELGQKVVNRNARELNELVEKAEGLKLQSRVDWKDVEWWGYGWKSTSKGGPIDFKTWGSGLLTGRKDAPRYFEIPKGEKVMNYYRIDTNEKLVTEKGKIAKVKGTIDLASITKVGHDVVIVQHPFPTPTEAEHSNDAKDKCGCKDTDGCSTKCKKYQVVTNDGKTLNLYLYEQTEELDKVWKKLSGIPESEVGYEGESNEGGLKNLMYR